MFTKERLKYLLEVYLQSKANAKEQEELDTWYESFENDPSFISTISDKSREEMRSRMYQKILTRSSTRFWYYRIAAVAAIFIAIISVLFYAPIWNKKIDKLDVIKPGSFGATLTLSNGKTIDISDFDIGTLANETGVKVSKTEKGEIVYQIIEKHREGDGMNILSTTNGQIYTVVLPDKSKVFLNAASSITYPISFQGDNDRRVKLSGEAYFEIAQDAKHPFIVETYDQRILVLGTRFNVSAYREDTKTTTTLLDGAINIGTEKESKATWIAVKPGQEAYIANGTIEVADVIAEDAIAWKEGYFRFNNETMEQALQKIGRWYDVKIRYNDSTLKKQNVYGSLNRASDIEEALHLLELSNVVTFKVEGKEILAIKKE